MRNLHKMHGALTLLLLASQASAEPSRWSRQIGGYTSDLSDWVPLTQPIERPQNRPIKRQAVAQPRILTEPFTGFNRPTGFSQNEFPAFFQSQRRPLYLNSVPTASQNFLTDQGFGQQGLSLALGTPNFPLSQGFVAPPQHSFESQPQVQRFPQNPVKFEPFQKPGLPHNFPPQKIPPPPPPPTLPPPKPIHTLPPPPRRPDIPKFIDGYRLENGSRDYSFATKRPQSLQKLKFDSTPQFNAFNQRNEKSPEIFPTRSSRPNTNVEREEVQLLYVPVESLNRGQFNYKNIPNAQNLNRDLFSSPAIQRPDAVTQFGSNFKVQDQRPQQAFAGISQDYLNSFNSHKFAPQQAPQIPQIQHFSTSPASTPFHNIATTPKPKKLKPHQPPLAVFMTQESNKIDVIKVADVLSTLKSAKNIAVLDSVSPANSPKVFIGPSSLSPPENYVKFELPYLSNLENTDRKLRQLPFFVAPLSYNTPDGFAKIPFPSPHVGSVIVNSLLEKDSNSNPFATSTPIADVFPNAYTGGPPNFLSAQKQSEQNAETPFTNSVTTKPTVSYFSTHPPNVPQQQNSYNSNFFSFEPQSVTSIKPPREPQSNILNNAPVIPPFFPSFPSVPQYHFQQNNQLVNKQQITASPPETTSNDKPEDFQKLRKPDRHIISTPTPTSPSPSTQPTSSKAPTTFPNYFIETHNPFSINQAFDFSSPFDVNPFEEQKKDFVTPSFATPPTPKVPSLQPELSTQNNPRPSSPNYLQNYSPEIHYQSEGLTSRFPSFDINTFPSSSEASSTEYQTPSPPNQLDFTSQKNEDTPSPNPEYTFTTRAPNNYEEYSANKEIIPTRDNAAEYSSTTTTTTRRPTRARGRPRYSTPKPSDQNESSSRAPVTRKPVRDRRPLPPRNRYESTKASTERATSSKRQPETSSTESSAYKTTRTRTRGRNQYKPTDSDDSDLTKKSKSKSGKEDLAYQRDVLHQNYPVTIMERMSTVDIEAITSPTPRISSTRLFSQEPSHNSYSEEASYVTEQSSRYSTQDKSPIKEVEPPTYTSRSTSIQTEAPYVPQFSSTINEEPSYNSRLSTRQYEEQSFEPRPTNPRLEHSAYVSRSSTSQIKTETTESIPVSTEALRSISFSSQYSDFDLKQNQPASQSQREEESIAGNSNENFEISKVGSGVQLSENNSLNEENKTEQEEVEEVANIGSRTKQKPRNRPFPTRQQPVSSTTEVATTQAPVPHKVARLEIKRRPVHPVTYRPAFNRRTTMRIEEIEAELKTKQVHTRPDDIPENRHPVYKPEPTTEQTATTQSIKKINQYRRKRPQTTFTGSTTTEAPSVTAKKTTYETKNRFRARRPTTEKPIQNSQEESTTITSQKPLPYNRFNHRSRIPDRYNRKPVSTESPEENENEQNADYSIHRPKVVPFEDKSGDEQQWPNFLLNSFKPYNPNHVQEAAKFSEPRNKDLTTEEMDIITARNDFEDILLTVTPASNRLNKKLPDIPPTVEAFVEQSKITTGKSSDTIPTIETVIEEMMKSLEEKDEDEYTRNVMKHEGGEIGEIPPEKVITFGENENRGLKTETTPDTSLSQESPQNSQETEKKVKRRGYWKRVNVRPVTTESFEVAESQFYSKTVNHIGDEVKPTRVIPDAKPVSFIPSEIKDDFDEYDSTTIFPNIPEELEITKFTNNVPITDDSHEIRDVLKTEPPTTVETMNPGDVDLGTGTPDPTIIDMMYSQTTEVSSDQGLSILESTRKDINGVMDFLFGFSTDDSSEEVTDEALAVTDNASKANSTEIIKDENEKATTLDVKKDATTETTYVPSEITESIDENKESEELLSFESVKEPKKDQAKTEIEFKVSSEEIHSELQSTPEVQATSEASFWDSVSTSMSTEVSHETEICFRGKCIKTNKVLV